MAAGSVDCRTSSARQGSGLDEPEYILEEHPLFDDLEPGSLYVFHSPSVDVYPHHRDTKPVRYVEDLAQKLTFRPHVLKEECSTIVL